jgi:hypothetical protein
LGEVLWTARLPDEDVQAVSPNGRQFATADGPTLIVRNLMDRSVVGKHLTDAMISDVAFSADSKLLAVTTHGGADILLANRPDKVVGTITDISIPRVLTFVGKGAAERLCIESYSGQLGHTVTFHDTRTLLPDRDDILLDADSGRPIGMTKSPDGEWLMISTNASSDYRRLRPGFWFLNVSQRKLHPPDTESRSIITSISFSEDGRLALDLCDRTIRIWRMPAKNHGQTKSAVTDRVHPRP